MSNFPHQAVAFPARHALGPAASAALRSLEALLAARQDVLLTLERHAAAGASSSSSPASQLKAEVALLAVSADRLATDIERLLAHLEALLPPEGPRRS